MNKLANLLTMFFVFLCICLFLCFLDSTNKVHDLKSVKAKIDFTENLFVLELFETIFHIKIIRTNLLIHSIRIAKRKNYERQLINSQLNIKITWKILNEIMNKKKACGPENIPGRILKETAREIAPSLCRLFNLSLTLGVFPAAWKRANITPIFKQEDPSLPRYQLQNYLIVVHNVKNI